MTEKLIRDLLAQRIPVDQLRIETDPSKVAAALSEKLDEEIVELRASDFGDVGEYADVIEVLYAMAARKGISIHTIEATRLAKLRERGGFESGLMFRKD